MLWAVNREANAAGLALGMALADARSLAAQLVTAPANPVADRKGLEGLALWCNRFTPCCAVDDNDSDGNSGVPPGSDGGLLLDISGCAHLFGGEAALMKEIVLRLASLGIEARLGLADTPGAAWALARFAPERGRIAAPGETAVALAQLPVEALRISSSDARLLRRLGLATIAAVRNLPRATLARRIPSLEREKSVLSRLDRVLGHQPDPITPIRPPPICLERLALTEAVIDREGLLAVLAMLMPKLIASLELQGLGVRRLAFRCWRVDGSVIRREVITARVTRDSDHLLGLLRERLETVDLGFGIDLATLEAERVETLTSRQGSLTDARQAESTIDPLIDRLVTRLGEGAVWRLEPVESHLPERAERRVAPGRSSRPWPAVPSRSQRPLRLFDRPEPVDAMAVVPDGPPLLFIWRRIRHHVAHAAGPERIEAEWWTGGKDGAVRDYYRVEDMRGRRYWLFRAGHYGKTVPRWYVHGLDG